MAAELGADRLELCQSLELGGLTPSLGLLDEVRDRVNRPVVPMVRTRAGDFHYDRVEVEVMVRDVGRFREAGAAGVVVGPLTADARIDVPALRRLVDAAAGLPVTFHRAIDRVSALGPALETLIGEGVGRVLTSGGQPTAFLGRSMIGVMVRQAGTRLVVMAGGGVSATEVGELVQAAGVGEIHLSGVTPESHSSDEGFGRAGIPNRTRLAAVLAALARV
jgi:copper homeostasis protein